MRRTRRSSSYSKHQQRQQELEAIAVDLAKADGVDLVAGRGDVPNTPQDVVEGYLQRAIPVWNDRHGRTADGVSKALRGADGRTIVKCTVEWNGVTYTRRTPRPYRYASIVMRHRTDCPGTKYAEPQPEITWSVSNPAACAKRSADFVARFTGCGYMAIDAVSPVLEATIHYREA